MSQLPRSTDITPPETSDFAPPAAFLKKKQTEQIKKPTTNPTAKHKRLIGHACV